MEEAEVADKKGQRCALCGTELTGFKYNPMKEWEVKGILCSQCYNKKLLDHYISPDRQNVTRR